MRYSVLLLILIALSIQSCTSEKTLFEKETWWNGHWQKIDDPSFYFSSGQRKVGGNEIVTPQFFLSTQDSILNNFYLLELIEVDHKKKYKLLKTNDNTYLKLQEIDTDHIDVYGPAPSVDEMNTVIHEYRKLPDNITPPVPDSILFDG